MVEYTNTNLVEIYQNRMIKKFADDINGVISDHDTVVFLDMRLVAIINEMNFQKEVRLILRVKAFDDATYVPQPKETYKPVPENKPLEDKKVGRFSKWLRKTFRLWK
jgi:hypothetical protein